MSEHPSHRRCRYCGETKPWASFVVAVACKWGRARKCKACEAAGRRLDDVRPVERECRLCGEVKPLEDFRKASGTRWGYTHTCRECVRQRAQEWRDANRETYREYGRRWRDGEVAYAELADGMLHGARSRGAVIVERVHPLTVLELHDGVCGICGEDVDPDDFHVDHIEPCCAGGEHSYDNTQLAHPLCNLRKSQSERPKVAA